MTDKEIVLEHFSVKSPTLVPILKEINFDEWFEKEISNVNDIYKTLCRTIVGQQLAGKAASSIFSRFELLLDGDISPAKLLALNPDDIRAVGLSWAKVRSVIDLSTRVSSGDLVLESLVNMENEELITELSKVKGIGRWTAEMFLMFRMGREDVFSWGDLGLKKGLMKFMNTDEFILDEAELIVSDWSPYKTYGAIAMWHLLDNR